MNLENIHSAHAAQYQKNEQPNQKAGKIPKSKDLKSKEDPL